MFKRVDGSVVYAGSHVGSRGTLSSLKNQGADDFSEGLSAVDVAWEEAAKSAMITREASFHDCWQGESHAGSWMAASLWGEYQRPEKEPPFGRR